MVIAGTYGKDVWIRTGTCAVNPAVTSIGTANGCRARSTPGYSGILGKAV